ncbi:hypothetical protein PVAND_003237 [Polypedilum vanderplanki]|uniref:Peptidase S1 domain-containing protein n=1 Tax=Polypedilum vanderplanki TaxID=319348 RepID=A0A9J6BTF5_POLVA|nr:hypothetical protein PVAND_003237 [Polypedilum vanderplanki]
MDCQSLKSFLVVTFFSVFNALTLDAVGIRRYPVDLFENDYCGLNPSVYSGKCKRVTKCINLLVEKKDIEVCSFGESYLGEDTLICCSREDFYKSRKHNKDGVLDYDNCLLRYKHLRVKETVDLNKFVINGVEVEPFEFSHIAAIGWLKWSDFSVAWNCGGNLITESFVMSAAHCMMVDGRKPNVVRLGDIDLKSNLDDLFVQQFGIHSIIKHPEYSAFTNQNDIALIRLRGNVIPTMHVVPACLNSGKVPTEYFEGAGYGQDENGLQTNKLLKVQLKLVEMNTCQKSYELQLSEATQICAESYREDIEFPQDLCYGDSGSALQYMNTDIVEGEMFYKTPTLVAITSFGIGCGFGIPAVYVNVSNYIHWIESIISP